jgi:hypothetical protein
MVMQMENSQLHAWQNIESELFLRLMLSQPFNIMSNGSEVRPATSTCFGCCLQTGRVIPVDFTVSAEFFNKKAADVEDVDAINSFSC